MASNPTLRNQDFPLIFTAEEAALVLKVSKCTVLRLANRGDLQGVKIGNQWRFARDAIMAILKQPAIIENGVQQ